jgi:hypothetical protein
VRLVRITGEFIATDFRLLVRIWNVSIVRGAG